MKKNWFYRLLLSYLPILYAIVAVLIAVFYFIVSDLFEKQSIKANEVFTRQVMQTIDQTLKAIDQTITEEINSGNEIEQFMTNKQSNDRYLIDHSMSEKLNDLNIGIIDTIYIYRVRDRMVLTQDYMVSLDAFADREFIMDMMRQADTGRWTDIRKYSDSTFSEQGKNVVSLVRKVPLLSGGQGLVVVNIAVSSIQSLMDEMSDKRISLVLVSDRNGAGFSVKNHTNPRNEYSSLSGSRSVLTSRYTGWEYSSINTGRMYDAVSVVTVIWMAIGFAAITLGGVWIIITSKKNYKPIEGIMERVRKVQHQRNPDKDERNKTDEFKYIEATLEVLIEKEQSYQKQYEQEITVKRQRFFKELIEGIKSVSQEEWEREAARYKLQRDFKCFTLAIAEVDKYLSFSNSFNGQDQALLKFALENVLQEVAENNALTVWTEWISNSRLGILFFSGSEITGENNEAVIRACDEVRGWMQDNWVYTVTFAVGTPESQISQVSQSYCTALEALEYKSAMGTNRIIGFWDILTGSREQLFANLQFICSLAQFYRIGDKNWESSFERFFEGLKTGMLSREEMVSQLNYLIYYLSQEMSGLSVEMQELWRNHAAKGLQEIVERFETIEEAYEEFYERLKETAQQMKHLRENSGNRELMTKVRRYIEENYSNPDLSLAHLSDAFGVHPNYVSSLFKDEFGEKFVDYLIKVRIDQAKGLLEATSDSVEQVANKVGYIHALSFIRVFKKCVGMTPGDYRKGSR